MSRPVLAWLLAFSCIAAAPRTALAADAPAPAKPPAAQPSPQPKRAPHARPAPKPVGPSLPAPRVTLEIEPATTGPIWTMRIKNTDAAPLRLVTDPRLLRITLPPAPSTDPKQKKAPKPVVCSVPGSARPQGDGDARILAAGKTYTQKFDVRTLCFSDEATRALDAATRFSAAYGFESKSLSAPFVVGPLDPTETAPTPTIANAKDISMADRDRGAHAVSAATSQPPKLPETKDNPPPEGALAGPRLTLAQTPRIDADSAEYASITTTLTNESSRSVALAFRPITLVLDVTQPSGRHAICSVAGQTALARDLVTTVGAGRATSLSVVLGRVCADGTFDERGIYGVTARIDTRKTVVTDAPSSLFQGEIVSKTPTLVRIRSGALPLVPDLKPTFD